MSAPASTPTGPLAGFRVVEVASMIFGPLAGQYLGDLGADVIKVEPPEGDLTRSIGPRHSPLRGSFFITSNRSKRSIVVDLKTEEGRQVLSRLLEDNPDCRLVPYDKTVVVTAFPTNGEFFPHADRCVDEAWQRPPQRWDSDPYWLRDSVQPGINLYCT